MNRLPPVGQPVEVPRAGSVILAAWKAKGGSEATHVCNGIINLWLSGWAHNPGGAPDVLRRQ